jgi:uncharacterized protein YjdB
VQPTFTWASSTPATATIDANTGVATAVANGTTTITASAAGVDGTTTLTVTQAVASIVVSPADPTLTALGATQAFTAQAFDGLNQPLAVQPAFAWASSTPATATIDANTGVATAVANGTTTITASAAGVDGTTTLTVTQAVASIVVSPANPDPDGHWGDPGVHGPSVRRPESAAGGAAGVCLGQLHAGHGDD